jgi:hypothetical protein
MGMHLVNKSEEVMAISVISWYKVLNLARMCGWAPAGTVTPDDWDCYTDQDWDGRYHSNDGQWVTHEDAHGIGTALLTGLDDIPDVEVGEKARLSLSSQSGDLLEQMFDRRTDPFEQLNRRLTQSPFEYFSGASGKERLREIAAFCQQGGFYIW